MKKLISILIPTYNEEENVVPLVSEITKQCSENLPTYDYEIIFIDNYSTDNTRNAIEELCNKNKKVKAIFNANNFGPVRSPFHGLCQSYGDCVICLCADFQDPIDMIPTFVEEWEKGYQIVLGIKKSSKENKLMYHIRSCYYKIIKLLSDTEQIEHFTGFGLYDKTFIDFLRGLKDSTPFLRGIVAEFTANRKEIYYEQPKRKHGKSKINFLKLVDYAMLSLTSYTKVGLRLANIFGAIMSIISLIIAFIYLVLKLIFWKTFAMGMAPVLIGVFVFSSIQIFLLGLIGEYIMSMNQRAMNRPYVLEEKRINFDI